MSSVQETLEAIQKTLGPYVRPREEVAHIRQVLALHLDSCLEDASAVEPLALVEPGGANPSPEVRGLQREYIKALDANIKARREYDTAVRDHARPRAASSFAEESKADRLAEHLSYIKLQKKQERLRTVERYLDMLSQKPAASENFLDPEEIFKDSPSLPEVPKEVVNGLTASTNVSNPDLGDLINKLEKQVLRAKLLLKREEQLLKDLKARSSVTPERISESAKLDALNTTRNELISWIETELGKASGDGVDEAEDGQRQYDRSSTNAAPMDEQLAVIKEKYTAYLAARTSLLKLVGQQPQLIIKPNSEAPEPSIPGTVSAPAPFLHLLSPYLERLLVVAHEQKGLITQKSHINTAIAKQLKDNCQILDHVAEESQLLPSHPVPGAARRKKGFGEGLMTPESLDSSSRVKPWVFAADSAKIASLEAIAEKIEEGQVALEESMKSLGEVDRLLGRQAVEQEEEVTDSRTEDDIWLTEGQPSGQPSTAKKNVKRKGAASKTGGDVWDMLDGNLGLLRPEDDI